MSMRATAKYIRVPPRKARLIADLVRGKDASQASAILRYTPNKTAPILSQLLKSAIANATSTGKVNVDKLYVQEIAVDPGPIVKRFTARAMGRGTRVNRRTSHIRITLAER